MKLGILGAGQLAQMLAAAAQPLGIQSKCYAQTDHCASLVTEVITGDFSQASLLDFAKSVDVITFENENVEIEVLKNLAAICPIYPNQQVLSVAQDRVNEKNLFTQLKIPTPNYAAVNSIAECKQAMERFCYPVLLKTRRFGYDGKGQCRIHSANDWHAISSLIAEKPCILEEYIDFQYEVSMLAVRNQQGIIAYYPLTYNYHQQGILRYSIAPWTKKDICAQAEHYTRKILEATNYVGVLAVEFFCTLEGQLLANEIAPRVHNSGHWTMDGAFCSQFENHVRAIFALPLGLTAATAKKTAMFNCIGQIPSLANILQVPGAIYHHYGKAPRAKRKLAHINVLYWDEPQFEHSVQAIQSLVSYESCSAD